MMNKSFPLLEHKKRGGGEGGGGSDFSISDELVDLKAG